jgi:arylsulfatase A-like enzyme
MSAKRPLIALVLAILGRAIVSLAILSLAVPAALAAPARPNVLLIVMDDQGFGDSSCYGATDVRTPRFDALAAGGVRFTRFRVNPLCAPTRASLLSGLSSLETGMWRGPSQKESVERALHGDLRLLPQYLKEKGYATGIFGKWHLGYESPNLPLERGFDEFVGFLGGSHPYSARRGAPILKDGKPYPSDKHLTDIFPDHAEDFIRRHQETPFFCYVPFNAVHGPLRSDDRPTDSARPDWLAKYESLPPNRRDYCAVLSHADDRIGRLLDLLKELGLEQSTLVICHSDNGGMTDKYPGNNGPLRGAKGTTYEGGLRVPAAMCWPGVIPAGVVSSADAAHFDVFATILDAAGIPLPAKNGQHPVHGQSLLPHARSGGRTALPDRYLFWDLYGKMAALHGDWKIVATIDNHHGKFDRALETIEKTQFELYNLAADPGEQHDVSARHAEIHRDLKDRYLAWFRSATR